MIWSKGDDYYGIDPGSGAGWTWEEARELLANLREQPTLKERVDWYLVKSDISNAMLLDGGSHSDIIYIRILRKLPAWVLSRSNSYIGMATI